MIGSEMMSKDILFVLLGAVATVLYAHPRSRVFVGFMIEFENCFCC